MAKTKILPLEVKRQIIKWYYGGHSIRTIVGMITTSFDNLDIPTLANVKRVVNHFNIYGCITNCKQCIIRKEGPKPAVELRDNKICAATVQNPQLSSRDIAKQVKVSQTTVLRVLRKNRGVIAKKLKNEKYQRSNSYTDSESDSTDEYTTLQEYFPSSDSSGGASVLRKRRKSERRKNFVLNIVNKYDFIEFKEHFKMSRTTVYDFIEKVGALSPRLGFGTAKMTSEKAVLMTVWYLTHQETFGEISERFDVTKSCTLQVIQKIVKYLVSVSSRYIRWPNSARKNAIRQGFQEMQGIGGVIGVIDGCHINIQKPVKDEHAFCNRKSEYSIVLQAVCDNEKSFIDFFCGEPGSLHNVRVLKRSAIYKNGINGLLGSDVLLCDLAYPVNQWLIPPFRSIEKLTDSHHMFNHRHSATRGIIEDAFSLLKGRFPRLKYFDSLDIDFIVDCVVAAGVLHNVCINIHDEIDYEVENDDFVGNGVFVNDCMFMSHSYTKRQEMVNTTCNVII